MRVITSLIAGLTIIAGAAGCDQREPVRIGVDRVLADTGIADRLAKQVAGDIGHVELLTGTSGEVLQAAYRGTVDLILVPATEEVDRLQGKGIVQERSVLLHDDYVLVGRQTDPAEIAAETNGALALRKINRRGASFMVPARGTAARFKLDELWKLQTDKRVSPGFFGVPGGVKKAVMEAHAQGAYTLVDRATLLSYVRPKHLRVWVLYQGGPEMANPYHLVLLKPVAARRGVYPRAKAMFDALTSKAVAQVIAGFGAARWGEPLYQPGAPKGKPRRFKQLPQPGMPTRAKPIGVPNPHGPGGLPMKPPHGPMGPVPTGVPNPHGPR